MIVGIASSSLPDLQAASRTDRQLRQVVDDELLLRGAIAAGATSLDDARALGDEEAIARVVGYLGEAWRIAGVSWNDTGAFANADVLLGEGVALATAGEARIRIALALIRWGELRRCEGQFDGAIAMLTSAVEMCRADDGSPVLHFAMQHLGKALIGAEQYDVAIETLGEARELRVAMGRADLVSSTDEALLMARECSRFVTRST